MKIISTLLIVVIPVFCLSQTEFKAGFIVKNPGDTIKGYLKQEPETVLQNSIQFTQNMSGEGAEKLTSEKIFAFGFNEGNYSENLLHEFS